MKINKKHLGLKVSLALATLSLGTVGFSAWIINGSNSVGSQITFTVGEVTDNSLTVAITDSSNNSVSFDSNSDTSNGIITGSGNSEDLTFGVTYTVTSSNESFAAKNATITYKYSSDFDGIKSLGDSGYIDSTCLNTTTFTLNGANENPTSGVNVKYDTNLKVATVTHTWTFKWGTLFGGENPCDVSSGDSAYTNLVTNLKNFESAAKTAMEGKTFTVTITPSY